MTRAELIEFLRGPRLAVQASVHPEGAPQAARTHEKLVELRSGEVAT